MTFRGYFALNNVEIANSSRVAAHLGTAIPTDDSIFNDDLLGDCELVEDPDHPGLWLIPETAEPAGAGLWWPPNGARRFGPGLYEVGSCWGPAAICMNCRTQVDYDDSWTGLAAFFDDGTYRPELAPWYVTELPQSAEFGGVWVVSVDGLDATPVERKIIETIGPGAVAGPHRDRQRTITFEALLVGCTNAGVDYGLKWLNTLLRATTDNTTTRLKYLSAHPQHSAVEPDTLVREVNAVVLTQEARVKEAVVSGGGHHKQANIYRVTWELTSLSPYAYLPAVETVIDWDNITRQPVNWIHAADCRKPESCEDMPVMFSTECVPEEIVRVESPPPVCGGCMPVSAIDKYSYRVPTMDYAFQGRETAVTVVITNTSDSPLTLQAFWRVCGTDVRCEDNQWPLQISGLPAGAMLHLDGITGMYWAHYDGRDRRPVGVVGTPTGAPWRPPVIDRKTCWEFVIQTASTSEFTASLILSDREP